MKGISIIICCYNSAPRIATTLAYLSRIKVYRNHPIEIILVNNKSTDDTAKIAKQVWSELNCSIPFKIVDENRAGLSFARQKGVQESKYEYLLFCDDDNWLSEDYLTRAFVLMESNSLIGVLGGTGKPVFEDSTAIPYWFKKHESIYAVGKQSNIPGEILNERPCVYGAGMFIRKQALRNINIADSILSDRKGVKLTSGGDTELCYRIRLNGYSIWWDEDLIFYHHIPKSRLNLSYVRKFYMDTAGHNYLLHGLSYKLNPDSRMFNSFIKKTWYGQAFIRLKNFILKKMHTREMGFHFEFKICIRELYFLVKLNKKYNKSFQ